MLDNELNEITKEKKKPVNKLNKNKETYGLEFVPNKKTLDAIKEAEDIISGKINAKTYSSFEEMWDDLIED